MTTVYLVRHGEAAATWDNAPDPGLSDKGWEQAHTVAKHFSRLPAMRLIASPLARTRQTAEPLAQLWRSTPDIDPRFAEIPSDGISLQARGPWLRQLFQERWDEQPQALQDWRQTALAGLEELSGDTVIFTHFVVINAVVSAVRGDTKVLQFLPDNGSITTLQRQGGQLAVVSLGEENKSLVN